MGGCQSSRATIADDRGRGGGKYPDDGVMSTSSSLSGYDSDEVACAALRVTLLKTPSTSLSCSSDDDCGSSSRSFRTSPMSLSSWQVEERTLCFHVQVGAEKELPKTSVLLSHPDCSHDHVAFKIRTTSPKEYLVRPSQGLIAPGGFAQVEIVVKKPLRESLIREALADKRARESEGTSAPGTVFNLGSEDQFLVQSCLAPRKLVTQYENQPSAPERRDILTNMWEGLVSASHTGGVPVPFIAKQRLNTCFEVIDEAERKAAGDNCSQESPESREPVSWTPQPPSSTSMTRHEEHMTLAEENDHLRRKFEELAAVTVRLLADQENSPSHNEVRKAKKRRVPDVLI